VDVIDFHAGNPSIVEHEIDGEFYLKRACGGQRLIGNDLRALA